MAAMMLMGRAACSILMLCFIMVLFVRADIENLDELYDAIANGPNQKVGFLSLGNYQVVKRTIPSTVEPIVVTDIDELTHLVQNGTLVAGLMTQVPPDGYNKFPSGIISPQTMMFPQNASRLLRDAIDAAMVRVISEGMPFQFARDNPPVNVIEANTCAMDTAAYPFPSAASLAAEEWFTNGEIVVASLGPVDWGNTGNYLVNPPTGFWPDYFEAISAQLVEAYGSTGFRGLRRVYYSTSQQALSSILAGETDVSEPYFVVDGTFAGRGRNTQFSFACFSMASGSTYFTARSGGDSSGGQTAALSKAAVAGVTAGAVALVVGSGFLAFVIFKERRGEPLFSPLRELDDEELAEQGGKAATSMTASNDSVYRL